MIIVKLQGGLGNQMFQYALGRSLSLAHKATLKFDSSYLRAKNQSNRTFKLDAFTIDVSEATSEEINRYRSTAQKIIDRLRPKANKKTVRESSNAFDRSVLERKDGYFDGHWNNEKYFENFRDTIQKDFTLKNPFGKEATKIKEIIASEPYSVSIHIRRGDYVSIDKVAKSIGVLPLPYYEQSIATMLSKFPTARLFVFSDDISWAKENLPKNANQTFVSRSEIQDFEELVLQSLCKHNIIANSTFSWWSAWLNRNPEKLVIAPRKWFVDQARNTGTLIPPSWLQI